jgi:probable H4MPT-linked C1 transfer pathway protein
MATPIVLGLDIGGANLKAATADRRAVSVPFALWKQPDRLPTALADLVAEFPDAGELAVTTTGELCDCFETKREGVNAIIDAVEAVANGRAVRVWSTDGGFVGIDEARRNHLKVAAANWHALATFAGRYVADDDDAVLVDIGSTTTDIIPLKNGVPVNNGRTDWERLANYELIYLGVRRTPVCALMRVRTCAELFATTQDVFVVLGFLPEDAENRDTADGRPLTRDYSLARIARMLGGDHETIAEAAILQFAATVKNIMLASIEHGLSSIYLERWKRLPRTVVAGGAGEFLVKTMLEAWSPKSPDRALAIERVVSLNTELGPAVSACAPAYALAVLATERRP